MNKCQRNRTNGRVFFAAKKILILSISYGVIACVPKQQFEEQEEELTKTRGQLKVLEAEKAECDPDAFIQLREQAQSLDLLQQELIDRNTELAGEVARLRVYEAQSKGGDLDCERQVEAVKEGYEGQLRRTRATYEDLIQEFKAQIREKDAEIASYRKKLGQSKSSTKNAQKKTKKKRE